MKQLSVLFLISLCTIGAMAQDPGEITGKLLDADTKEPIPFAFMTLTSNSMIVMQIQSNEFGLYTFKPVSPGTYDIEILGFGYDTAFYSGIEVSTRGMTYKIFEIKAGVELPPITVRTPLVSSDDEPTIVESFDAKDISHMAVTNVIDVAVTAPQVQQNEQTGGLYIAGSREDATLYIVDGVKVIGSLYLPMKAIKQINVITGGIPANYGDVTGGIIEITTKSYSGFF